MPQHTPMQRRGPNAPLINIEQAAVSLGVSVRFMRRLVNERRIPFHKVGRYVRFDRSDIDQFVLDGRVEPAHRRTVAR